MAFYSAFWGQGYWNQGFQIARGASVAEDVVGDSPTRHSYDLYLKKEQERLKLKQQQIIDLRLEAQQALMAKRELELRKEKQNTRQLQAIQRREAEIQKELLALIDSLREFDLQIKKRQEQDALIALFLACPFSSLVVH